VPAGVSGVGHVFEVAIGVRIVQRAMLGEAFDVVGSLHLVQADDVAGIGARHYVAVAVEVESPGVAAPFAEQLEAFGGRVVAPDALLKTDAANVRRDGAALRAVEPAVGAPLQGIDHGVRVFHAKTLEQHLGVAVGQVVAVLVGIEQQVRRLADVDAAVANGQRRGEIQTGDEVLGAIRAAVAVGVFEDRDLVFANGTVRRRLGHAVVFGAQVAVDIDGLQAGRVRILQVLDDPHPAAVVEGHGDGLPHVGFGGEQFDVEAVGHFEPPLGLCWRKGLSAQLRRKTSCDRKQQQGRLRSASSK